MWSCTEFRAVRNRTSRRTDFQRCSLTGDDHHRDQAEDHEAAGRQRYSHRRFSSGCGSSAVFWGSGGCVFVFGYRIWFHSSGGRKFYAPGVKELECLVRLNRRSYRKPVSHYHPETSYKSTSGRHPGLNLLSIPGKILSLCLPLFLFCTEVPGVIESSVLILSDLSRASAASGT